MIPSFMLSFAVERDRISLLYKILTLMLRVVVYFGRPAKAGSATNRPEWRNWQTRTTQNRVPYGNEGSIPSFGTRTARNYTLMGMASKTSSRMQEDVFILWNNRRCCSRHRCCCMCRFHFSLQQSIRNVENVIGGWLLWVSLGKGCRAYVWIRCCSH